MNSNKPLKRINKTLTDKQNALIKEIPKDIPNYQKAKNAGYSGTKNTLAVTYKSTIKALKKKDIKEAFEDKGINNNYIADNLTTIISKGTKGRATASDSLKAIELIMKARGDLNTKQDEVTDSMRIELDGLTDEQLTERLNELGTKRAKVLQVADVQPIVQTII